jgi:arylsulfatase A-like enzyme
MPTRPLAGRCGSTRREFLGWAAGAPLAARLAAAPRKPNVIIILVDDLGWADIHSYGSPLYDTPNVDRLAGQGVRFTNGYAACPVCSPTRASIMTGRYPARLHLTDWIPGRKQWPTAKLLVPQFEQQLPLEEVTIAEALKPEGYVSAAIGKWHLGAAPYFPEKQGFDVNIGGTEKGSPPSYFPPYRIPGLEPRSADDYLTDNLTARAEQFIDANKDRPFFLYFAHFAVHLPLGGKPDLVAKYKQRIQPGRKPGEGQHNPAYAAMVESMDQSVGRIMAKLDELKLAENTAVFFVSDNGGLLFEGRSKDNTTSNAPLRAGKGHLYEGGIRVPTVVRWPGHVPAGVVNDTPVCTVDLYPTIMEMTGAAKHAGRPLDGTSLTPALRRGGKLKREALYWHYPHYSNQGGAPGGAVREGDFKLIEFYEDNRVELYNVKNDPGEHRDLAAQMPAKAAELRRKLDAWRRSVNAVMPSPNPAYDAAKADQGLTGSKP